MKTIMFMNAKGGSGKSTLASNLASYYALCGSNVVLADFDMQGSCMDWLSVRPSENAKITGIAATSRSLKIPRNTDYLIMDAPGAVHGRAIDRLVRKVDTLIIPVTPSPVDFRATARFIQELLLVRHVSRKKTKVACVANRVREVSHSYEALERFLDRLSIPLIATLHDSDSYIRASGLGLSIFELNDKQAGKEQQPWMPLLRWIDGEKLPPVLKNADAEPTLSRIDPIGDFDSIEVEEDFKPMHLG